MVDRLIQDSHEVILFDNLSSGDREFIRGIANSPLPKIVEEDLSDHPLLSNTMEIVNFVYHVAVNADVRPSVHHPE